jgi:hypothetical protein
MPLAGHGIARLRDVTTRSISPENLDGGKGGGGRASKGTGAYAARDLGPGWKVSPSVIIGAGATLPMAVIESRQDHPHLARPATTTGGPWCYGRRGSCGRAAIEVPLATSSPTAGVVALGQLQHDRCQPARRLQLLLARCPSSSRQTLVENLGGAPRLYCR